MLNGYINCRDARLYYEIYGDGEPLVFLHGNGEEMSYFLPQVRFFSENYKVVLIDSRGHGKSSLGNEKISLELMSSDIIQVLNELNLDKINLVGFSDGGNIALKIALKKPEVLKTITLIGANLKPTDLIFKERLLVHLEYAFTFNKKKKDILKLMIYEPNFSEESLKGINMPTLVVAGESDAIKERCTKTISRLIENSRLEIIKDGDHFLSSNKPEVFNKILLEFLEDNK